MADAAFQHSSEAVVVGAIGDFDVPLVNRMAKTFLAPTAVSTEGLLLQAEGALHSWRSGSERGWTWATLDCGIRPTSVTSARDEAGSVGVAVGPGGRVTLHADHLGVWPVYVTQRDNAVYFSNRLRPVLAIIEKPKLDRVAWASLMSLRFVPPGRSIVEQISTFHHGETLRYDPAPRTLTRFIDVPPIEPDEDASLASLVDEIGDVMLKLGEVDLFLSGGLDSRLLLASGTRSGASISCLTTDIGDGQDRDQALAGAAASITDVPVTKVLADGSAWTAAFAETRARMDYATTLHTWASGLTRSAIKRNRCAAAGMGGGILLNSHLQDRSEDFSGTKEAARAALVARLGLGTLLSEDLLADHLRSVHAELEEVFVGSTEAYSERPNWQAIAILTTRTARATTPMITRLAGPDIPVVLPYLAPRVMRACLAAHIHGRRGIALHRAITSTISPDLTKLKTTLDVPSSESLTTWRRRTPDSLAQISTAIASDDVATASLGPSLQKMVVERDIDALTHATRYYGPEKVLHGALLLSRFRASYPTVTGDLTG